MTNKEEVLKFIKESIYSAWDRYDENIPEKQRAIAEVETLRKIESLVEKI